MFVAMSDPLHPHHFSRSAPNYEGLNTPSSAVSLPLRPSSPHEGYRQMARACYSQQDQVSSFNYPYNVNSTLVTPVSLNADSPGGTTRAPASSSLQPWYGDVNQQPPFMRDHRSMVQQSHSNRMKSKESSLSLQVPPITDSELGNTFPSYMLESPQPVANPSFYLGAFGVSAPQNVQSPTVSAHNHGLSTPQLTNASSPTLAQNTPLSASYPHHGAPLLMQPTPGQLRPPRKESHENLPHPSDDFQFRNHRQLPYHGGSPTENWHQGAKRESPSFQGGIQKRRKPSGTSTPVLHQEQLSNYQHPTNSSFQNTSSQSYQTSSNTSQYDYYNGFPQQLPPPSSFAHQAPRTTITSQPSAGPTGSGYIPTEDEEFLLHLRDDRDPKPDWKKTAAEYNARTGKNFKVPALQMKYSRLKERLREWTEKDIKALTRAKAAFEKTKWDIISSNMLQYGCGEKWSARACQLKHAEMCPEEVDEAPVAREGRTPTTDEEVEEDEEMEKRRRAAKREFEQNWERKMGWRYM